MVSDLIYPPFSPSLPNHSQNKSKAKTSPAGVADAYFELFSPNDKKDANSLAGTCQSKVIEVSKQSLPTEAQQISVFHDNPNLSLSTLCQHLENESERAHINVLDAIEDKRYKSIFLQAYNMLQSNCIDEAISTLSSFLNRLETDNLLNVSEGRHRGAFLEIHSKLLNKSYSEVMQILSSFTKRAQRKTFLSSGQLKEQAVALTLLAKEFIFQASQSTEKKTKLAHCKDALTNMRVSVLTVSRANSESQREILDLLENQKYAEVFQKVDIMLESTPIAKIRDILKNLLKKTERKQELTKTEAETEAVLYCLLAKLFSLKIPMFSNKKSFFYINKSKSILSQLTLHVGLHIQSKSKKSLSRDLNFINLLENKISITKEELSNKLLSTN
jgi:hypothetical protein